MWHWKRTEKISWTDHVRNEEVLQRVKGERNILSTIKRRKDNWIGHILLRNCRLKLVFDGKIDGKIEVTRRRGRRCKQLLSAVKKERGYSNLKEDVLDRILWWTRFGRCYGPAHDRRMNVCFIEPDSLCLLLGNYELVTKANQHENSLIRSALYAFTLPTKYLVCLWTTFVQVFPGHSRFYGFKQQSCCCSYKDKGFQSRATWHIATSGHRARGLVACNTNTSWIVILPFIQTSINVKLSQCNL